MIKFVFICRCLLVARLLRYKPEMAAQIVNACCMLHNIAIRSRLQVPELSERERYDERRLQLQHRHEETVLAPAVQAVAATFAGTTRRVNPQLAQGRAVQQALVQRLWANRTEN